MEGVVLQRVGIFDLFFFLNRVRISDPHGTPYFQPAIKCPSPPGVGITVNKMLWFHTFVLVSVAPFSTRDIR